MGSILVVALHVALVLWVGSALVKYGIHKFKEIEKELDDEGD